MRLSLGPVLYYWSRDQVLRFYEKIAQSSVDVVYLGEVVCSRRHEMRWQDWLALAQELQEEGKDVVFSTQVLVESKSGAAAVGRLIDSGDFLVEANDMGAVHVLSQAKLPFVAGSHLNLYNAASLEWVFALGALRWVPPLEMAQSDLFAVLGNCVSKIQTEVFACGRMPLAFSARCFTARHLGLNKDNCDFRCIDYPDGLLLKTQEQEEFLVLNGIQTQSDRVFNLMTQISTLKDMNINLLRLSPQSKNMFEIIEVWHNVLCGTIATDIAAKELQSLLIAKSCNGYWHKTAGMDFL